MANALRRPNLNLDEHTVSTPEGDNEYEFDEPLQPRTVEEDVEGLQQWPSNSKMEYDKNRNNPADQTGDGEQRGFDRTIDEVSTQKIQP
jgi:hypothetical protein